MKVTVQQDLCDVCRKNEVHKSDACLRCGKLVCWQCTHSGKAVQFNHAVNVSGSADGKWCAECVAVLTAVPDKLFAAYLQVRELVSEWTRAYKEFEKRAGKADEEVVRQRRERGLDG